MSYSYLELSWRAVYVCDIPVDGLSDSAVLLHRTGVYLGVVEQTKEEDLVYVLEVSGQGSLLDHLLDGCGLAELLGDFWGLLYQKIEASSKNFLPALVSGRLLSGEKATEGTLQLVCSYVVFVSPRHPEDPVEYTSRFEFVCFLDHLMSNVVGLNGIVKNKK